MADLRLCIVDPQDAGITRSGELRLFSPGEAIKKKRQGLSAAILFTEQMRAQFLWFALSGTIPVAAVRIYASLFGVYGMSLHETRLLSCGCIQPLFFCAGFILRPIRLSPSNFHGIP
jgi:hypothetical protein